MSFMYAVYKLTISEYPRYFCFNVFYSTSILGIFHFNGCKSKFTQVF